MPPKSTIGGGLRFPGGRKLLVLCSALIGLAAGFILLFSQHGLYKIYHLRQERNRLERETAKLLEENTRLARTIDRLHNDPEMIQDLIRRELNYVKANEVIIQLPEAGKPNPPAGAMPQSPHGTPKREKVAAGSPQSVKKAPGTPRRAQ